MYKIDLRNWKTTRADFLHVGILLAWFGKVRVLEKSSSFDEVMTYCPIFESVKIHINAYISHPIRDKTRKLNMICIFKIEIC